MATSYYRNPLAFVGEAHASAPHCFDQARVYETPESVK
jgi:hypothetical protein